MFKAVLLTQWKWARATLLLAAVTGFAIPILSVQRAAASMGDVWEARRLLASVQSWSAAYPLLAAAIAIAVALSAWTADHRGRHIYALSLPIQRWRFALLRLGAGACLLIIPIAAVWIGALAAASAANVPAGLATYPTALALRFALAVLVAYSLTFAIAAGTPRTSFLVLSLIGGLFAAQMALTWTGANVDIVTPVLERTVTDGGPLGVFVGRWMLIDV